MSMYNDEDDIPQSQSFNKDLVKSGFDHVTKLIDLIRRDVNIIDKIVRTGNGEKSLMVRVTSLETDSVRNKEDYNELKEEIDENLKKLEEYFKLIIQTQEKELKDLKDKLEKIDSKLEKINRKLWFASGIFAALIFIIQYIIVPMVVG